MTRETKQAHFSATYGDELRASCEQLVNDTLQADGPTAACSVLQDLTFAASDYSERYRELQAQTDAAMAAAERPPLTEAERQQAEATFKAAVADFVANPARQREYEQQYYAMPSAERHPILGRLSTDSCQLLSEMSHYERAVVMETHWLENRLVIHDAAKTNTEHTAEEHGLAGIKVAPYLLRR